MLNGGVGADTPTGGAGNDSYVVDGALDVGVEAAAGGTDGVQSSVSTVLATEVDNLTLTGSADINGTGNTLGNVLAGNSGANVLDGGAGNDTVSYAAAPAGVTVNLSTGLVTGGAGTDSLLGRGAANVLIGGVGADTLQGAAGADIFVLNSPLGSDMLSDFASASDKLRIGQAGVRVRAWATATAGSKAASALPARADSRRAPNW